ncbi:tail tape measure protein [Sphingorhabdus lutea]|uniref:Tail tape measure protein n=1 Tax=Sphingorhabdus lutea TaxID=1913578 RepID=A0A1L3JDL4_9SPHN|nr:tail tape measure protein [Sphingorhabdus lutea]APG63237.1 tail tape measure protein [Sphingorhabdus lutea]
MNRDIDELVIAIRADTGGFARDLQSMKTQLDGPFADGLERAGRGLERGLLSAIERGKFGFEDLRKIALSVLSDIASSAIKSGIGTIFGASAGGQSVGISGILGSLGQVAAAALGAPGRATGGPVSSGRAYMVGENGPELFVPSSGGNIVPQISGRGANVNININVSDNGRGSAPDSLRKSSRQIARQVRQALSS